MEPTQSQIDALVRLKQYFPYRIIFGVLKKDGTFDTYATKTKHTMNRALRSGDAVFTIK